MVAIEISPELDVAVLIPCLNEERTIASVISGFQSALPNCDVYVYDNSSTDSTVNRALEMGAVVLVEPNQGKGNVVRRMFADIEADVYLLVDGDGTYDAGEGPALVKRLIEGRLDMVVGSRKVEQIRRTHKFGNKVFNRLYRWLFGSGFTDIFSGYRALSRRYVKSFPALSNGFEIETEMSVHASQLKLPIAELPISYNSRPEGSESKLRTVPDGLRIVKAMIYMLKENRPLALFGWLGAVFVVGSLSLGIPIVVDFVSTGLVERLPTAILATGMALMGLIQFTLGLLLDSVARGRSESKRLSYLKSF